MDRELMFPSGQWFCYGQMQQLEMKILRFMFTPGGHSWEVWVELCRRGLQPSTLFKTKNYRGRYFLTLICFVLLCIQN